MYKAVFGCETISESPSLRKVCRDLWDYVKIAVKEELALQVLETSVWVEGPDIRTMDFYDMKEHCYDEGWISEETSEFIEE